MTTSLPACPKCSSAYTYEDRDLLVCPECAHEWKAGEAAAEAPAADGPRVWKDANGTLLADGDTVTVIKDLKLKGSSSVLKLGTKLKNMMLVDEDLEIDCLI